MANKITVLANLPPDYITEKGKWVKVMDDKGNDLNCKAFLRNAADFEPVDLHLGNCEHAHPMKFFEKKKRQKRGKKKKKDH